MAKSEETRSAAPARSSAFARAAPYNAFDDGKELRDVDYKR